VRLDLGEITAVFHHLDDALARLETVLAVKLIPQRLPLRGRVNTGEEILVIVDVYPRIDGQDVDCRQFVPLADLEVVEVVRRA
jgi:hypothetical protein